MRLIDADATYELLKSLGSRDYRREKGTICDAMKMVAYEEYTPTVDATQVIRCKDCVHRRKTDNWCAVIGRYREEDFDDWFCADGELEEK